MISIETLFRKSLVGILQSPRFSEVVLTDVSQLFLPTNCSPGILWEMVVGVVCKNNLRLMVDDCWLAVFY